MRHVITIYTDGACKGNPGPGGWGAILVCNGHEKILRGGAVHTTNNRMELTAVLEAIKALTAPCDVTIVSDSKYVIMSRDKWLKWQNKSHVPNWDLWQELVETGKAKGHIFHYQHVNGHSGHVMNERCDRIASEQACKWSHKAAGTNTLTINEALAILEERK